MALTNSSLRWNPPLTKQTGLVFHLRTLSLPPTHDHFQTKKLVILNPFRICDDIIFKFFFKVGLAFLHKLHRIQVLLRNTSKIFFGRSDRLRSCRDLKGSICYDTKQLVKEQNNYSLKLPLWLQLFTNNALISWSTIHNRKKSRRNFNGYMYLTSKLNLTISSRATWKVYTVIYITGL